MKKINNKFYGRPYQNKPKIIPKKTFKQKIKDNLNKILFWVIITAFCLFTVGSTLGIIAYSRTAKADSVNEVSIYQGNNFNVSVNQRPLGFFDVPGTFGGIMDCVFDFAVKPISVENSVPIMYFNAITYAGDMVFSTSRDLSTPLDTFYFENNQSKTFYVCPLYTLHETQPRYDYTYYAGYKTGGYAGVLIDIDVTCHTAFNGNVERVSFSRSGINTITSQGKKVVYFKNYFTLYDINQNMVTIDFETYIQSNYPNPSFFAWEGRTYYTASFVESGDSFQTAYWQGFDEGYYQKADEEYQKGYDYGKNVGEEIGYDRGKLDGLNTAQTATLYNLISTIFNVPITSFIHLINFEFFGVNLANFFTGILTLAVILFIVSKIWGK